MRVAVSATGKELDCTVDQRFGRAEYLLIVDTESNAIVQVIDNQGAKDAQHGAGINTASLIAQAGAQAILTGYVGPKAAAVCEKAGIVMVNGAAGTVAEAVHHFVNTDAAGKDAARLESPPSSAPAQTGRGMGQGGGMGQGRGLGGGRRQGQCGCQGRNRQG
ncbi:MAG: dinitrogenase iron-molybdenum cofactor biosynthesis protein [Proteobacteria bacterium]|nr:dinitrogenase iron-molybdenum cofactor biosynthesis protein [Pseudomonadota bacterium]MBU4298162.1 dinitrogenase iron-molybdenum cofactor biosynthesis protein [Pseudomonadota bacterium]MCG2748364.1 dinitrogenase iron-molybdenum cofactor biosynthesis protein [Desulfobulbaceae bacterium]